MRPRDPRLLILLFATLLAACSSPASTPPQPEGSGDGAADIETNDVRTDVPGPVEDVREDVVADAAAADADPEDAPSVDATDSTEDSPDGEPEDADLPDADRMDVPNEDAPSEDADAPEDAPTADVDDAEDSSALDTSMPDATDADVPDRDAADTEGLDTTVPDADTADVEVPDLDGPPRFERIEAGAIAFHNPAVGEVRAIDYHYGFGIAPADVDGDGDLDLFVGTLLRSTQRACVYENVSVRGTPAFALREAWCAPTSFNPAGATGVDMDGDGRHELIAYSEYEMRHVRFDEGWTDTAMPPVREDCVLGAAMPHDIDQSGQLELLTACVIRHARPRAPTTDGDEWCYDADAEAWQACASRAFAVDENAIAIGAVDANEDGLLDIISVCDTLGGPDAYDPTRDPGGWHFRCAPGAACDSELIRFAPGGAAWGSFMGFGAVGTRTGWVGVFADIGPFGVFGVVGRSSYALDLAPELAWFRDEALDDNLFSWGVVPGDWDDDGDDDVVMTFGRFARDFQANDLVSRDTLFVQNNDTGALDPSSDSLLQFEPHTDHRDPRNDDTRLSRAAVQVDIDGDQRLEIIIASVNGPPFVYQHLGAEPRCTIRPTSRYVETWGTGYEIKQGPRWVPLAGHGEVLSSDGPWLVVPRTTGQLRFPSGGIVDYACGDAGYIDVTEPEWLSFTAVGGTLTAQVNAAHWTGRITRVEAAVEREGAIEVLAATETLGGWVVEAPGTERVMWQVNGRWVERWLPVAAD